MAKLNIAPTKSNLLLLKDQLVIARDGHNLLEQKREILVMELMRIVEKIKLLEREIQKSVEKAYPSLRSMLMTVGEERIDRISHGIKYDFSFVEKSVTVAGMHFKTLDVNAPKQKLFYSFLGTYSDSDKVIVEFFKLLNLLTQMASIRTIAWRLAMEVKKTQRRVNALSKLVIPQTDDTRKYIEGVLEERERENTFTLKSTPIFVKTFPSDESSRNLKRKACFPTSDSPIITILNK